MSTGRHGKTVDRLEIIEAVTRLTNTDRTLPGGGVTVEAIASELSFEPNTIAPYCRELSKSGELERTWGIGPHGPKLSYKIPD